MTELEKKLMLALEEMLDIVRLQTTQKVKTLYACEIAKAENLVAEVRNSN